MIFEANCQTTAMGVMPHTDIEDALKLVLTLDIPFWPQLPRISYYHDMYAQTAQNFPEVVTDIQNKKLSFNTARFHEELWEYSNKIGQEDTFALPSEYAVALNKFLELDLSRFQAIRGQSAGPVSLGFKIMDEENKPIIYNSEVKALLFDFIQRKVNYQYRKLKEKNPNAFVWIDDPALSYVFSSLYGYHDLQAKEDYHALLQGLEGPKGLHLCTNVNLPYLLELGVQILSFDAFQMGLMPKEYAEAAAKYLKDGGIICWGIVPTETAAQSKETPESLAKLLMSYWEIVSRNTGIEEKQIAAQSLLAPAKCCIKDVWRSDAGSAQECASDLEIQSVNKAFAYLNSISTILRDKYKV